VGPANGGAPGRAATISIEDVMLHARMLAGALGVDLSMLVFADQLSGGAWRGGFFRVSAQAADARASSAWRCPTSSTRHRHPHHAPLRGCSTPRSALDDQLLRVYFALEARSSAAL
jgi:hypothetical protein